MSAEWYATEKIREFIMDNLALLEEFFNRKLCESILEEHLLSKNRTRAISFMLTLLYFKIALSRMS
jgi:hypothetical protein